MSYLDYCVSKDITIREAMNVLDKVSPQIVFILNDGQLIASLTDGDIRRYLLKGGNITDCVEAAGNMNPRCAKDEDEAIRMYHLINFVAVPIVDINGKIIDIYFGNEGKTGRLGNLGLPVVINAGGKGTRLEPFTKILPKPLIPVGDMPITEHIIEQFDKYGCDEYHIIVNYKKELIKAYFVDSNSKHNISWYDENKPLGTGGGLCYLKGKIDKTFFFTNCDNLLLSNYESMLRFHRENNNVITMVCAYKNFTIPYGVVEMGVNGSIKDMKEKPEMSFLTNTGIYLVEPEVLEDIPDEEFIGFPDIIEQQMKAGKKVSVYPVSENDWLDMGQLSELERMRIRLYGK
ncbi:MAG: sugar phosphate nucleotidyltransferase [Lachnospiraceae bacterium]|nr:sugar phosphate nucleotidyltransferase [Lachnospiraceae bacterium]